MIEIVAPDGTIVEFPDDTPVDVIERVMAENFGPQAAPEGEALQVTVNPLSEVDRLPATPEEEPDTTASGVAGAALRGIAPAAMGAGLGAAIGAPIGGVGAVPGALVGAAAGTLAEIAGDPITEAVNRMFGTNFTAPTEAMENLFTSLGIPEARTEAERIVQAAMTAAGGGGVAAGAGRAVEMAAGAGRPVLQGIGRSMAAQPAAQVVGGAGSGAASELAAEEGMGAVGQLAAGVAGGLAGGAGAAAMGARRIPGTLTPNTGARQSVGAAATPEDVIRVARAQELPVPIQLANFQKTRAFEQQQRARELAKNNEVGQPIRDLLSRQQREIASNFDSFLERTGSEVWNNLEDQGVRIVDALKKMAAADKTRINTLYKRARESKDATVRVPMAEQVEINIDGEPVTTGIVSYLNNQPKGVPSSGVTDAARQIAERLKIVKTGPAGKLIPGEPTVRQLEEFRREVSGLASFTDPSGIRQERILKELVDAHTEPYATGLYKEARAARREFGQKYQDVSTIANLMGTRSNTPERVIAAEKVVDRLLGAQTSAENLRKMKALVTGEGGDPQAWREVQGATIETIRRAAYPEGALKDEAGNVAINVNALRKAIGKLDREGKLEVIFDKEQAQQLRTLADVAQDVFTSPPGSVNFSNTSSALQNAMDILFNSVSFGVPMAKGVFSNVLAPLKAAKERAGLRQEVKELIGEVE